MSNAQDSIAGMIAQLEAAMASENRSDIEAEYEQAIGRLESLRQVLGAQPLVASPGVSPEGKEPPAGGPR